MRLAAGLLLARDAATDFRGKIYDPLRESFEEHLSRSVINCQQLLSKMTEIASPNVEYIKRFSFELSWSYPVEFLVKSDQ